MSLVVLIAEDELYTRKSIIKLVADYPSIVPLTILDVSNSRAALEEMEKNSCIPDIALLDIYMNGEECFPLVPVLRDLNPDIQISFISAYSEFHYAQQALRLGVQDYLVKPIDVQMLYQILDRMIQSAIQGMAKKLENLLELRMLPSRYGRYHSEDWHDMLCLPVMMVNHQPAEKSDISNLFPALESSEPVVINLVAGPKPVSLVLYFHSTIECINRIHFALEQLLKSSSENILSQTFVLGHCYACEKGVIGMFNELFLCAIHDYSRHGKGHSYFQNTQPFSESVLSEELKGLHYLVQNGISNDIESFFHQNWPIFTADEKSFSVLISALNELAFASADGNTSQYESAFTVDSLWNKNNSEAFNAVCAYTRHLCSHFSQGESSSQRMLIGSVKAYIDEHYREDICIRDIAKDIFYVHSKYLSSLFSKVEGVTISDYILKKRMEAAHDMLTNTDISITEISSKIGYNSLSYFIQKFKRYYGYVPSSLRS